MNRKTPVIWDEWIDEARGEFLGWKPIIEIWRGTKNLQDATNQKLKGFFLHSFFFAVLIFKITK